MKINWFPGHMKKALDQMRGELSKVDVVIYVLDSRAPLSSINPKLNELSGNKPVLYVFNKIDIADSKKIDKISSKFKGANCDFIKMNSTCSGASKEIVFKVKKLVADKIKKYSDKGIKITIRAMIVGVPNSGKSTLTNNLCKKAKAVTGNKPGVTKSKQWFNIGDCIEICDTPGTLYPNLENQETAKKLAFVGSIKDGVLLEEELASELILYLENLYPGSVEKRYKGANNLQDIAKVRGFVCAGGELDLERCAKYVINDFRAGNIGCFTLD